MSSHNDLTAEAIRRGAVPGRGYAVARLISQVCHPVSLGVMSVFIVGLLGVESRQAGLFWALLCTALQIVPPTVFFSIRLRQGAYSDDDVSIRSQRNELYLFGIVTLIIGMIVLYLLHAPKPFLAMSTSSIMISVLAALINLYWKISIHASSMGSTATLAALYSEPLGLAFWLCALVLGWARVRTRNHTPMQVVAGLMLSVVCVLGAFMLYGLL